MERTQILTTKKNFKNDFYKNRKVNKIEATDVNKTLVSKKEPYGTKNSFKYFIGYNDNDVIRPLCVKLPQRLAMLENLMKMQQCLLGLTVNSF